MTNNPGNNKPHRGGSARSPRRWWRSAGFAWEGLVLVWSTQPNFRIEVWATVLVNVVACLLRADLAPILLSCALVLTLEVINTSLEALTDLISPDIHPLAKIAKDTAAGAVLIASMLSVLVGLSVLGPPLWQLLGW